MSPNENTKDSIHQSVVVEVANALGNSAERVKLQLKSLLVDREINKRVEMLDKAMVKLREAKSELNKIRPPVSYTPSGEKVDGNFSKEDFEKLKKAKEKVSRLEAALEKAFAGQEFDKLSSMLGGKDVSTEADSE